MDGSKACLGPAVEPPAVVSLKTIVEPPGRPVASPPAVEPVLNSTAGLEPPGGSLASMLGRVMERATGRPPADVEAAGDDQGEPPAERPSNYSGGILSIIAPGDDQVEPPAEQPARPPQSDHRRRLHEWVKGLGLDAIAHAELVLLIQEMLALLAGCRPAEGTTFDPHEQVRLALQGALEVEATGELSSSPGIYARGTIRKRISRDVFTPLVDPSIKAKARAGPDLAELAQLATERKRVEAEEEARKAAEKAALEGRWNSLPDSQREAIEARVRAENPGLLRFKVLIHAECLERMDDPPPVVESSPSPALEAEPPPVAARVEPPVELATVVLPSETLAPDPPLSAAKVEAREAARARQLAVMEARIQGRRVEPPSVVEVKPDDPPGPIEAKSRPGVFRRLKELVGGTLAVMAGVIS